MIAWRMVEPFWLNFSSKFELFPWQGTCRIICDYLRHPVELGCERAGARATAIFICVVIA